MFLSSMLGAGIFKTIGLIIKFIPSIVIGVFKFLLFMPLYLIFMGIMMIATFAEMTFKKLSGVDTIYLNGEAFGGGSGDGKDLVYAFITDSAVQDVFWSIVGLSIILLFIFTIVAMIKSEFTIDLKGSAKAPIISRALKSLVNLLVVPVVTIISIFGTNFLTTTIYDLFSPNGQTVVTKCFQVGAYNANRARCESDFIGTIDNLLTSGAGDFTGSAQDVANTIDSYFMNYTDKTLEFKDYSFVGLLEAIDNGDLTDGAIDTLFFGLPKSFTFFTLFNMSQVSAFYNLAKFDWILAIGSGIVITWTLLSVCLVLVKRVFELCILFLLAPPMTAIAPLDGGQAEKKWRGEFMKRLLAVIAPIFAYNMYFLLIPLFENISLFSGYKMAVGTSAVTSGVSMLGSYQLAITDFLFIFDIFFQLICVIVGLGILKSASALLSNLLGVEDLVKSGGEAAKKAVDVGKKAALGATAIGGVAVKGAAAAIKGAKGVASGVKNKIATRKDRKQAKDELEDTKKEANDSADALKKKQDEITEEQKTLSSDTDYQEAKATYEKLKNGGNLTDSEKQDLEKAEATMKSKTANLEKLRTEEKGLQKTADEKAHNLNQRNKGISSDKQAEIEALEQGDEKDKKKAERIQKRYDRSSIWNNVKSAYNSEFGEEAETESVGAKVTGGINKFAQKHLKGVPILNKIPELTNSLQEQFSISGGTAKRRLNDALAGMFGEGGGGDLWKIWFNKNARANLYEGVPESKKRSAGIEQELSWTARDKYYEKKEAAEKAKQEDKLIRRMLASNMITGVDGKKYRDAYAALEKGDASPTQIKKLEAEIEKLEVSNGVAAAAKSFAKDLDKEKPGGDQTKTQKLAEFKEQMKSDAAQRTVQNEIAEKQRVEAAIRSTGGSVETKITEQSSEQLAKAIERALSTGKGVALKADSKGIKIDGSSFDGLKQSLDGVNSALTTLKEILDAKKGEGGNNGSGNDSN